MPMEVGVHRDASSPAWNAPREYAVNLEVELQKICDGILALMDEGLILSASTGEPREFCYEMKGDYYRFFVDVSMVSQRQAPMIQKERKTVEVPQVMTQETVVPVTRPYPEYVDVPYANPIVVQTVGKTVEVPPMIDEVVEVPKIGSQDRIPQRTAEQVMYTPVPQVVEEFVEVFKVFLQDRVQQRMVEQITETPAVSLAEEIVEAPKIQTQEETIDVPVVTQGQLLASQTLQTTVEMPPVQVIDRVVDVPVVAQR